MQKKPHAPTPARTAPPSPPSPSSPSSSPPSPSARALLALLLLALLLPAPAPAETHFNFAAPLASPGPTPHPLAPDILRDAPDVLRLINRENLLPKDYPDQTLPHYQLVAVTAPVTKRGLMLRPVANDAVTAMLSAAQAEGIALYVASAHRTHRHQEVIHYNRLKEKGRDDGLVQIAGASEHQAGLAADVVSWAYRDGFQTAFGDTPEGRWLAENCARYGFILRYPSGKTDITGVRYEPWHMRYVGPEAAAYITENGLTLEEFTAEIQSLPPR